MGAPFAVTSGEPAVALAESLSMAHVTRPPTRRAFRGRHLWPARRRRRPSTSFRQDN